MTEEPHANSTSKSSWVVAAVAWIAAIGPHFFFSNPLELHMRGDMESWIAIAVWSPAMLAAAGFFDAGEFSDAFDRSELARFRAMALVAVPFAVMFLVSSQYRPLWTDMPRRPWDELATALPLFAGLWALTSVYWQGLVQLRLLSSLSPVARVAIVVVAHASIVTPFALHTGIGPAVQGYITSYAVAGLLTAVVFELGASVRATMLIHGILGAMYIWFQQAVFL